MRKAVSIRDYWEIFLRRKWSFLIPFVTVILVTAGLAYILPNIYRSTVLIIVEPQRVPETFVKPTITTKVQDRFKTITQLIMSRTLLEKIIQEFGLYQGTGERSRLETILANIPWMASYWTFTALDPETAVGQIRKNIEVSAKGDSVFTISYQGADPETTMQVTNKLASLFIEENLKVREQQVEGTTEFLESELNNSRLLLERQDQQIKEFKQRYMGELPQQLDANLRALDRFQLELKSTLEALKAAEDRKESFEKLLATSDPDDPTTGGGNPLIARLIQLKTQLSSLQAEYKEDYPDITLVRKEIREIEETLAKDEGSSEDNKKKKGEAKYRTPLTQNLLTQINTVNFEISSLKNRRANLLKQIDLYEKRVENTPLREQQLMAIMRDYQNIQNNYQSLLNKRLEAKISESLEKRQKGEIFRVQDPANYPLSPNKPNRGLIVLMGILIGAGFGIGLVFLREQMDQCFTTEEELSETAGIEVLASIPHQTLLKRNQPLKGTQAIRRNTRTDIKLGQRSELVVQKAPPVQLNYMVSACDQASVMAEQFRVLQARLAQVQRTKDFKLICVTSAVKGEGKTFTAVNLAITMARDFAKKTLLMDMDCKSPMLQRLAGREDQTDLGWADVIMRKCELQETLIPFHTEKLFLLLAGKVNHPSSSLITSPGFYGLLQDLRREFDYIVVDAPPILPLADLRLLEDLVDGIILVIRAEATTRDVAVKALTSLQRDKVLGVVLNDRRRDSKHYHDYYDNGSDLLKGGRK